MKKAGMVLAQQHDEQQQEQLQGLEQGLEQEQGNALGAFTALAWPELHARLQRLVDRIQRVENLTGIGFRAPLSEVAVHAWEERHGLSGGARLPEAYRLFLTLVGDGGGGSEAVMPLEEITGEYRSWSDPARMAEPFPHNADTGQPTGAYDRAEFGSRGNDSDHFRDEETGEFRGLEVVYDEERQAMYDQLCVGTLQIAEDNIGYGGAWLLVVSGEDRGAVWRVQEEHAHDFTFIIKAEREAADFIEWIDLRLDEWQEEYEAWADREVDDEEEDEKDQEEKV
jgi:hypothetical protein